MADEKNEQTFQERFDVLGSGWNAKSGTKGTVNIAVNEGVTLKKGDRLNLFVTKNKKNENSPDFVLCRPKDQ